MRPMDEAPQWSNGGCNGSWKVYAHGVSSDILAMMENYRTDDDIFALATPWGESALAVVRTSGPRAVEKSCLMFSRPGALRAVGTAGLVHGFLMDRLTGEKVDEVMASVYREGHGYTGEEAVEFSCHGSLDGIKRILRLCADTGFRPASPGEFTFRAFIHGRMDLTKAEAVQELVSARSSRARVMALDRLGGALFSRIEQFKQQVLTILSGIEVQLDYAEDEIGGDTGFPVGESIATATALENLAASWHAGQLYGSGARVVLAGATNAGKSSLFNLLLKDERAIVSDIHGTTRDYLEVEAEIDGIPVRLYDTAGLRESADTIEGEGMRRTMHLMEQADIIVLVKDGSVEKQSQEEYIHEDDNRLIVVHNKSDLRSKPLELSGLWISVKKGEGISALVEAIALRLRSRVPENGDEALVIESNRQRDGLYAAAQALRRAAAMDASGVPLDIVAAELHAALRSLGELTGEVTSEDVLERIFSGFCVGK